MKIEIDKPVIPQFVAEWIESLYNEGGSKYDAIVIMFEYSIIHDKPVLDWFIDNKDTFINAVMHGYDIQKESLYYAKIKGGEILGGDFKWVYLENSKELIIGDVTFPDDETEVMTKEEWNELGINDTNADFEEVE